MKKLDKWLINKLEQLSKELPSFDLFTAKDVSADILAREDQRLRYNQSYYFWSALFILFSSFTLLVIFRKISYTVILFYIGFCFFLDTYKFYKKTYQLYINFLFWLHKKLPDCDKRTNEIKAFHEMYARAIQSRSQPNPYISPEKLLAQEYLADKNSFCRKYFKIKSSNFVQFYDDRVIDSSTKEVKIEYIIYSLLIPRRLELSHDALRRCLQNYPALTFRSHNLTCDGLDWLKPRLDVLFKEYSLAQIERLFTNYQGNLHFYDLFDYLSEPLPVARSFQELHHLMCEKKLPPAIRKIQNIQISDFTIKVLLTRADYEHAAKSFKNCIKSYYDRGDLHVILFFSGSNPEACVAIKDEEIDEIKGVANSAFFKEREVVQILKEHGVVK